jgi:hypothetical protein
MRFTLLSTVVVVLQFTACNSSPKLQEPVQSIAGQIDEGRAMGFIYGNYDPQKRQSAAGSAESISVYHTQAATLGGRKLWFLYTWTNPSGASDCHACQVDIDAWGFMLQQPQQVWVPLGDGRKPLGSLQRFGSFGQPPQGKTVQWGKDCCIGVLLTDGFTGQGQVIRDVTLFGYWNGVFQAVFSMRTGDSNMGSIAADEDKYEWTADWQFGESVGAQGAFDIRIHLPESNKYPPGAAEERKDVPVGGTYRFDGTVYRHVDQPAVKLAPSRP